MSGFIDNYLKDDELVLWNGCHNTKDSETESNLGKIFASLGIGVFGLIIGIFFLRFVNTKAFGLVVLLAGILCIVKAAFDSRKTIKSTDLVYYWVTNKKIASMCIGHKNKIYRIQSFEHVKKVIILDTDDGGANLFFEPANGVETFSVDDAGQTSLMDVYPSISFLKALESQMILDILKGYTNIEIVQGLRREDKRSGTIGTTHKL